MSSSPEAPHSQGITETLKDSTTSEPIEQPLGPINGHSKDQLAPHEQPLIDLSEDDAQVTSGESSAPAEAKCKHGDEEMSKAEKESETQENGKSNGTEYVQAPEPPNHRNTTSKEWTAEPGTTAAPEPSHELASTQSADPEKSPPPPPLPPKDDRYISNTQATKTMAALSSDPEKDALRNEELDDPPEREVQGDDVPDDSRSEIQSIMTQFQEGEGGLGETEIMSPRLEIAQPMFAIAQHPPRKSSLDPIKPGVLQPPSEDATSVSSATLQSPPPRTSSLASIPSAASLRRQSIHQEPESPLTPQISKHLPPPPQPEPEPELPFDFHRFLEQLRHRSADPVARYLRSFLLEFGKRQWMVHEQVKLISDFLEFISKKMAHCEVWQTVSDAEFDNAREGMEKLVMNRLYNQTFSPAIPPPQPVPGPKGKRRGPVSPTRPGRRGQHQEDVERDQVLAQKVRIYGWVHEEHLDIKPIGDKGKKFMTLAQQGDPPSLACPQTSLLMQATSPEPHYLHKAFLELLKINSYRAPRDKVICILNCCKVIFGFLRNTQHDQSADSFIPLLIYVVLHANPENLVSNVQYILRFRNQDKLGGEAGYYISSLMGAIQFIENLDRTSLTISDDEFEKHVEKAVSAIAEKHSAEEELAPPLPSRHGSQVSSNHLSISEKSTISRPEVTPRNSLDAERALASPRRDRSQRNGRSTDSDDGDEMAAVTGLLKTIQKPLSTIGRIFGDDSTPAPQPSEKPPPAGLQPPLTPQPQRRQSPSGMSSSASDGQRRSAEAARQQNTQLVQKMSAEDAAARQASAEAEEARRLRVREESNVVETLCGMFPGLDRDVIMDVVRANEGRYVSRYNPDDVGKMEN